MSTVDLRPWLQAKFGQRIEKHGTEWGLPCPTCDEDRTKEFRLWWNVTKNVGTCYKCHRAFNTITLVQALEEVSYAEAMRLVKENTVSGVLSLAQLQLEIEKAFTEEPEKVDAKLPSITMPSEFKRCTEANRKKWPRFVLTRISFPVDVIKYGVGWCDSGYYANRMLVPVVQHKRLVSFIARDMTGKAEKKVLYPKGIKTSRMLFNYDVAKNCESVVMVEGVLDAITVGNTGIAIFGTSLSNAQVALLVASKVREVVCMFDGDAAGEAGAQKAVKRLGHLFRVKVATLPKGVDPSDLPRSEVVERALAAPRAGEAFANMVERALR